MTFGVQGILPVLPTPFRPSGAVDYVAFSNVIESAIRDGAHALVMFGLASEYYKLDDAERDTLTAVLIGTVRSRVPVVISITDQCTELAVRRARAAQDAGASALMVLPPFFLNPSVDAVLQHVQAIAEAVELPLILQFAPRETGLTAKVLESVAADAVKVDANPSADVLRMLPKGKASFVGYMGLDLPHALAAGCSGCMPTASLVKPFVSVWEGLRRGDGSGEKLHAQMLPLLEFMMQSVNVLIAAEKHLLVRKGLIPDAFCRRPAASLTVEQLSRLFQLAEFAL